jgi:F-type H+-transporting ATPase subunit a
MNLLGLITGVIQAYIFAILAMVYIAAATRTHAGDSGGEEAASGQEADAEEQ